MSEQAAPAGWGQTRPPGSATLDKQLCWQSRTAASRSAFSQSDRGRRGPGHLGASFPYQCSGSFNDKELQITAGVRIWSRAEAPARRSLIQRPDIM